jgi:hypothetical protein
LVIHQRIQQKTKPKLSLPFGIELTLRELENQSRQFKNSLAKELPNLMLASIFARNKSNLNNHAGSI